MTVCTLIHTIHTACVNVCRPRQNSARTKLFILCKTETTKVRHTICIRHSNYLEKIGMCLKILAFFGPVQKILRYFVGLIAWSQILIVVLQLLMNPQWRHCVICLSRGFLSCQIRRVRHSILMWYMFMNLQL
jgi:hypothetical protein